jgi:hypothetical protein
MVRYTLRAACQLDGRYRISVDPEHPEVSSEHRYEREEVEQLARRIDAELRWVEAPGGTRSTDPWGGALPPVDED